MHPELVKSRPLVFLTIISDHDTLQVLLLSSNSWAKVRIWDAWNQARVGLGGNAP